MVALSTSTSRTPDLNTRDLGLIPEPHTEGLGNEDRPFSVAAVLQSKVQGSSVAGAPERPRASRRERRR